MVVINGAGIAGLTLANALQQKNIPFVIIERSPTHEALGSGIVLQNNGLAIIAKLGLMRALPAPPVMKMAIGLQHQIRRVALADTGLDCRVVHRQQLQTALLANLPAAAIRLNASIVECSVSGSGVAITLSDHTTINADYLVNAAGIRSDLHARLQLRDTQSWCWRTLVPLRKPIDCFGEYWFGQQRIGIAPINDQQAYVFHVVKLAPGHTPQSVSTELREQWIQDQAKSIPDLSALQFTGQTWLSHPLQDRSIHWGNGRLVAIGDAAHAMTPNLGQGAVLAMEDAMELAHLVAMEHDDPAGELARIRHKRVAQMHRLSYWMGTIAHLDNAAAMWIKSRVFRWLPLTIGVRSQVAWMNQFTQRLKEI